jgi:predicted RNA binding protein YcfA (HicA-like mRNA interferase family)
LTGWGGIHIIHPMDSRTLIRMLEAAGWKLVRVKGSHHQFRHPAHPNRVACSILGRTFRSAR